MRKAFALLFTFIIIAALTACEANENKPLETTEKSFAIIEAKDCFYDAGFVELIAGAEAAAVYGFAGDNSETVQWSVYVLEEAFEEGYRYIKQVSEPVLTGDGEVAVEPGQFVYVYCSANEFTTDVADENANLNVTIK